MSHRFHRRWLRIAAIIVGCFGPIFFLGTMAQTSEPARLTLDLLSWPVDGGSSYASPDTRFLSALTGGFLLGWGVTIWCLAAWVYPAAPEGTRRAVIAGLVAWCVLDSAGSIASGNLPNVFFNLFFLVVTIGPLWRPARPDDPQDPLHPEKTR